MKKFATILTVISVCLFCFVLGYSGTKLLKRSSKPVLTILHVNDTHSHFEPVLLAEDRLLGGVVEAAAYVDSVRRKDGAENVLLVHAGDFSQGSSYFTELDGDLEIDVLNATGYDVVTIGNHEFDNGIEELARRLSKLNCPVVCANYDFSTFELGKYITPYTIIEKAGRKIGIIGVLTDLRTVVDRDIVDRIPFFDTAEVTNKWADYLRNEENCDLVICLTHIGYAGDRMSDRKLVTITRNIDLMIGGHSHTFLDKMEYETNLDGKEIPIVQAGSWGEYFGEIHLK